MGFLSMLRVGDRGLAARRHRRTFTSSLSTSVESLESRVVLSHTAAPVIAPLPAAGDALKSILSAKDLAIDNIQLDNLKYDAATGLVTATGGTISGVLAGLPFTTQITNFALQLVPDDPATPGEECSVLDLELAPIHLSLLGLHVDTSPICLSITAFEDQGLLGDLLCSIAGGDLGLLNSPDLTGGLSKILGQTLGQAQPGQGGDDSVCTGDCEILELVVGPLDLNLLGVNVHLDDCNDGPVQICVSATADEGILGGLLCGLTTTPIPGIDLGNLDLKDITKLIKKATDVLKDGQLSVKDLDKVLKELTKALKK